MVQSGARKKECLRILFWLIPCALLFTAAPSPATAQFKAWVMAKLPDTPAGLGAPICCPQIQQCQRAGNVPDKGRPISKEGFSLHLIKRTHQGGSGRCARVTGKQEVTPREGLLTAE
jgi:hypothetical protein